MNVIQLKNGVLPHTGYKDTLNLQDFGGEDDNMVNALSKHTTNKACDEVLVYRF